MAELEGVGNAAGDEATRRKYEADAEEAAAKARKIEARKERLRQGGRVASNVGMSMTVLVDIGFGARSRPIRAGDIRRPRPPGE